MLHFLRENVKGRTWETFFREIPFDPLLLARVKEEYEALTGKTWAEFMELEPSYPGNDWEACFGKRTSFNFLAGRIVHFPAPHVQEKVSEVKVQEQLMPSSSFEKESEESELPPLIQISTSTEKLNELFDGEPFPYNHVHDQFP
jgi:hypothetical protein